MSVAASSSMPSPRPPSPGGRHRSRPSFAIGYSQPSPLRMSTSSTSIQTLPTLSDPRPSPFPTWPPFPPPHNQTPPNPSSSLASPANPPSSSPSKHFVAPAHPQSHHLHTLPPREKTTRTLILDHTAWRQGRTRFAQGRCELGMAVRFKNEDQVLQLQQQQQRASGGGEFSFESTTSTGVGQRPGFYIGTTSSGGGVGGGISRVSDFGDPIEVELASSDDEGDEDDDSNNGAGGDAKESDGEGVRVLMYGKHFKQIRRKRKQDSSGNSASTRMDVDTENEPNSGSESDDGDDNDNDAYNYNEQQQHSSAARGPRSPSLASLLAARATGIEKVLQAMLAQPPSSPPRSPSPPPYALHSSHANSQHYRAPPPPPPQQPSSSSSTRPSPQPTVSSSGAGAGDQSRVLPNGLRLRLALMALVNDLFERQLPPGEQHSATTTSGSAAGAASDDGTSSKPASSCSASSSESSKQTAAAAAAAGQSQSHSAVASLPPLPPPSLPPSASALLPPELAALAQISSQPFYATPSLPSFHTLTLPSASASSGVGAGAGASAMSSPSTSSNAARSANSKAAAALGKGSMESGQSSAAQQTQRPPPPLFSWTRPTAPTSPLAAPPSSPRSINPSTHDKLGPGATERVARTKSPTAQPLSSRYPSSWKRGMHENQPDKYPTAVLLPNPSLAKRARGRSKELFMTGCYARPPAASTSTASTSSFRTNAPMYNYSSTARQPNLPPGYPLKKLKLLCPRHLRDQCRICTSSARARGGPSTRIGAGLLKKKRAPRASRQSSSVLAELIPRFLRLSALVAMELGREARGEEPEANDGQEGNVDKPDASEAHHPSESPLLLSPVTSPVARGPSSHAQPTRAWFALLCGLLTRAVLEGYVARDWKGSEYAEVILGVGLGIKGIGTRRGPSTAFGATTNAGTAAAALEFATVVEEEPVDELEPDEMPHLVDAGKVLFSGLVQDVLAPPGSKDKAAWGAEDEYVVEMEERLSEFLTISHTTPDLATHFTQLSEKYPAEPVERAALRFCEAVAKWRGKPELEMYKKHVTRSGAKSKPSTPLPLSIEALLASTPTPVPHRPPIDKYFRVPPRSSSSLTCTSNSKLFFQPQHPPPPPPPLRVLKRRRSVDELEREAKKERVEVAEGDFEGDDDDDKGMVEDVARDVQEEGEEEEEEGQKEQELEDAVMKDETSEWVGPYGV